VIADLKDMGVNVDLLILESKPTDRALEGLRDGLQRMMARRRAVS
jgi:hypothetical protein